MGKSLLAEAKEVETTGTHKKKESHKILVSSLETVALPKIISKNDFRLLLNFLALAKIAYLCISNAFRKIWLRKVATFSE